MSALFTPDRLSRRGFVASSYSCTCGERMTDTHPASKPSDDVCRAAELHAEDDCGGTITVRLAGVDGVHVTVISPLPECECDGREPRDNADVCPRCDWRYDRTSPDCDEGLEEFCERRAERGY